MTAALKAQAETIWRRNADQKPAAPPNLKRKLFQLTTGRSGLLRAEDDRQARGFGIADDQRLLNWRWWPSFPACGCLIPFHSKLAGWMPERRFSENRQNAFGAFDAPLRLAS